MKSIQLFFCALLFVCTQTYGQKHMIRLEEYTIKEIRSRGALEKALSKAEKEKPNIFYGDYYRLANYEMSAVERKSLDKKAIRYYKKASKMHKGIAYNRLAYMYYHGRGVKKSTEKCLSYLYQSAEEEFPVAQYNLGKLYIEGKRLKGNFLEQDLEKAESYLIQAGGPYGFRREEPRIVAYYRRLSVQYLVSLYGKANYSPNGSYLSFSKVVKWSGRLRRSTWAEQLYENLSEYETVLDYTQHHPNFIPGLSLAINYTSLSAVDSLREVLMRRLSPIGTENLEKLEKELLQQYLDRVMPISDVSLDRLFREWGTYIQKNPSSGFSKHLRQEIERLAYKQETSYAQRYSVSSVVEYLEEYQKRHIAFYRRFSYEKRKQLQELILAPIKINQLPSNALQKVLPILNHYIWHDDPICIGLFEQGERLLHTRGMKLIVSDYLGQLRKRCKYYDEETRKRVLWIVTAESSKQWGENIVDQKDFSLEHLVAVPKKGIKNDKRLEAELLGILKIVEALKVPIHKQHLLDLELLLLKAQRQQCYTIYRQYYTSENNPNCLSHQKYVEVKKSYYQALKSRLVNYDDFVLRDLASVFFERFFITERIRTSSYGRSHSYTNLYLFVHEILAALPSGKRALILKHMGASSTSILCRALNMSARKRFHGLVDLGAQYTLLWHIKHTNSGLVPSWSASIKEFCSFCNLASMDSPGGLDYPYKYQSYSALAYAKYKGKTSIVALLERLGVQKEKRDIDREAKDAVIIAAIQKKADEEKEEREQHFKFLKTVKVNDCVEGYIYYKCTRPLIPPINHRIKVKGRLVNVAADPYGYCFLKISSIEGIEERINSSYDWERTIGLSTYCPLEEKDFIGVERQIQKKDILYKCY